MASVTEAVQKTHRPRDGAAAEAVGQQETASGRTGGLHEAAGTDVAPRRGAGRAAARQARRSSKIGETSGAPHQKTGETACNRSLSRLPATLTSPVADGSNKGVQGQRLFAFSPNSFERLDASLNSSNSFDAFLFTNLSSSVEPMSVTKIPSTAPTQPLATLVASTSSETVLHSVRPSLGMAPAGHGMQVPSVLTTPGGQVLQSSPEPVCSVPGADAGGAAHLVLGALLAQDGAAALRAPQVGPAGAAHLRGADPVHDADLRADLQLEHGLDGGGVGVLMLIKAASKVA